MSSCGRLGGASSAIAMTLEPKHPHRRSRPACRSSASCTASGWRTITPGCATWRRRHSVTISSRSACTTTPAASRSRRWRRRYPPRRPRGPRPEMSTRSAGHMAASCTAPASRPAETICSSCVRDRRTSAEQVLLDENVLAARDRICRHRGARAQSRRRPARMVGRHRAGPRSTSCGSGTCVTGEDLPDLIARQLPGLAWSTDASTCSTSCPTSCTARFRSGATRGTPPS